MQRSREMGLDAMSSEWMLFRLDCELVDPVDALDLVGKTMTKYRLSNCVGKRNTFSISFI